MTYKDKTAGDMPVTGDILDVYEVLNVIPIKVTAVHDALDVLEATHDVDYTEVFVRMKDGIGKVAVWHTKHKCWFFFSEEVMNSILEG